MLAGLKSFITGTVLPVSGVGALSGLTSTDVENELETVCVLRREVVCVRLKLTGRTCT